ncbi:PAS domain S-box protein [Aliifodinibius sp. S!AR15-10]|uniref:PAS domain-containing protein n=1 Tax=Aliifodinibius sp. S!AR15-10 TaxID=2950437 RepID=UPI002858822B|nr:PAS domain S-box protein [Aliifodinibius sp. S!AR15-10]MDR8392802.1 PAS domain S-box protein [Aliifodinibius sp. S!AR15-10]
MGIKNIDLFFEDNPNPMWIYDPDDFSIIEVNEAALQLYGYNRNEALSLSIKDLRPQSEIPKLITEVEKRKPHFNNAGIWEHRRKDGSELFVHILSTPIYDGDKMCKLVLAQNVTEQVQAEQELNIEKEFMDALAQNIPGTFYIFDDEGNMLRWNKNVEEITGYSTKEIRTLDALDFFKGKDKERISEAIGQAFKEGSVEVEASLVTKKGDQIPFYFSASRIILNDKPYLLGVGIDISKQKSAQDELLKQQKLLEAIMEQSGSFIFVKDVDGPYRLVNKEFRKTFGLEQEDIIGKTDSELFEEKFAAKIIKDDKRVLKSY